MSLSIFILIPFQKSDPESKFIVASEEGIDKYRPGFAGPHTPLPPDPGDRPLARRRLPSIRSLVIAVSFLKGCLLPVRFVSDNHNL